MRKFAQGEAFGVQQQALSFTHISEVIVAVTLERLGMALSSSMAASERRHRVGWATRPSRRATRPNAERALAGMVPLVKKGKGLHAALLRKLSSVGPCALRASRPHGRAGRPSYELPELRRCHGRDRETKKRWVKLSASHRTPKASPRGNKRHQVRLFSFTKLDDSRYILVPAEKGEEDQAAANQDEQARAC
jgi:hypothetical protein